MIQHSYDAASGIVTATATGLLTVAEVRQSYQDICVLLQRARDQKGRALLLVDSRESMVQPREVVEQVERDGSYLSQPNDRMAMVLPSTLSGIQSRRIFANANERIFNSMDEAISWLTSD